MNYLNKNRTHLAFHYGSNLCPERLRERARDWDGSHQVMLLHGYQLCFNKRASVGGVYANAAPHPRGVVWGIVTSLSESDQDWLNECEGHPTHYRRTRVELVSPDGEHTINAEAYIAQPEHIEMREKLMRPQADYLNYVLNGARHYNFPADYIASIERHGRGG